jgi:DNA mismatch endonuclease, patch repair protein
VRPDTTHIAIEVPPSPRPSSPTARKVMLGNRSESTIERLVRSELHRRGLRFRKHAAPVPGLRCRPDVVFTKARVAVFVDGCFWHRCPTHGSSPKANASYWRPKLDANVARDRRNDAALAQAGWSVLRFWAHEPIDEIVQVIVDATRAATGVPSRSL